MVKKLNTKSFNIKTRGKYDTAGLYCIKINNVILYIGKSKNMSERVLAHIEMIERAKWDDKVEHKYKILYQLKQQGYRIQFDVMYRSSKKRFTKKELEEDIGFKEAVYINQYLPILNTQIPKLTNWRKFSVRKQVKDITIEEVRQLVDYDF